MPHTRSRRGIPDVFEFEGVGDVARDWLDKAFGARLRLAGELGTVRHQRADHGTVAFDHLTIGGPVTFDADAMPALVVVDVLGGSVSYTRDGVTDVARDGETILAAGWDMPFSGSGEGYDIRTTSIAGDAPRGGCRRDRPRAVRRPRSSFRSYVPHSRAAARGGGPPWTSSLHFPEVTAALGRRRRVAAPRPHPSRHVPQRRRRRRAPARGRAASSTATARPPYAVPSASSRTAPREELTLEQLARAVAVTPRALQYAFRKAARLHAAGLPAAGAARPGATVPARRLGAVGERRRRPVRLLQPRAGSPRTTARSSTRTLDRRCSSHPS